MFEVLGICKECGSEVNRGTEMLPSYPDMFECACCGYPSTSEDLQSKKGE